MGPLGLPSQNGVVQEFDLVSYEFAATALLPRGMPPNSQVCSTEPHGKGTRLDWIAVFKTEETEECLHSTEAFGTVRAGNLPATRTLPRGGSF